MQPWLNFYPKPVMVASYFVKDRVAAHQFEGISLNAGIGLGRVVLHQPAGIGIAFTRGTFETHTSKSELIRLDHALAQLVDEVQGLIVQHSTSLSAQTHAPSLEVLNTYLLLANDPGWKRQLREKVQNGKLAKDAIDQVLLTIQQKLRGKGKSSVWQERISDFEDLSARLKGHLTGLDARPAKEVGDFPFIVVADHIGPVELLDYDRDRLAGLILVEPSSTSHVAIVARSLEIPVVGGVKGILSEVQSGDAVLVDGNEGRIYIRPGREVIGHFDIPFEKVRLREPSVEVTEPMSTQTRDNVPISLLLNVGLVEDVDYIEAAGAEGVGLYRTEIPFMLRSRLPNVVEQTELYREILDRAGKYPVVFRTLDVSGDKVLPYLEQGGSKSPSQDQRAVRIFLDRPVLLRYQLRALVRASRGCDLTIMLPMVAEVSEVQAAKELLGAEIERERERGNPTPAKIRLGAMIEVPSLVHQLPQLFPHVDFLSVGSNDLFQFFYAIDRRYSKRSKGDDVLSPTFLNLLKSIHDQCQAAQMPLSICGEMAGRPLEAIALIGLGYQALSMSTPAIPLIKNMVRNLTYQEIAEYMAVACATSQKSIRQDLRHFALTHGIPMDKEPPSAVS